MTEQETTDWFAVAWVGLVFLFLLVRSFTLQITPDEAYTFHAFIQPDLVLQPWLKWEANNHILNTLLSASAVKLFGLQNWALRLPNVLAWMVYGWSLVKLLAPIPQRLKRNAALMILSASPLILELLGLSRGYGLSLALMLLSLLYFQRIIKAEDGRPWRWLLVCCLMLLANLNLLPFVALTGLVLLVFIQHKRLYFLVVWLSLIILFAAYGWVLKNEGLLYFGGNDFWSSTISKSIGLMTGHTVGAWSYPILLLLSLLGFTRFHTRWLVKQPHMGFWLMLIFIGLLLGSLIQHFLLGTPYPDGRTAVHIWLLFLLGAVLMDVDYAWAKWVYLVIAVASVFSAAQALQWKKSYLWGDAYFGAEMLEALAELKQNDIDLRIASSYPYPNMWAFLQRNEAKPVLPQTMTDDASRAMFDVLIQPASAPISSGHELYTFDAAHSNYVLTKKTTIEASNWKEVLGAEATETDAEFINLADTQLTQGASGVWLRTRLFFEAASPHEVYFVLKADDGRYRQIDLTDYAKDQIFDARIVRHLGVVGHRNTSWSCYLWNPSRVRLSKMEYTTGFSE